MDAEHLQAERMEARTQLHRAETALRREDRRQWWALSVLAVAVLAAVLTACGPTPPAAADCVVRAADGDALQPPVSTRAALVECSAGELTLWVDAAGPIDVVSLSSVDYPLGLDALPPGALTPTLVAQSSDDPGCSFVEQRVGYSLACDEVPALPLFVSLTLRLDSPAVVGVRALDGMSLRAVS